MLIGDLSADTYTLTLDQLTYDGYIYGPAEASSSLVVKQGETTAVGDIVYTREKPPTVTVTIGVTVIPSGSDIGSNAVVVFKAADSRVQEVSISGL
jgi:hypothetical protein